MSEETLLQKKASQQLFYVCWIVYAILSLTRNAFGSAIAPIVQEGFMTKSQAGVVNGVYYVFYGGAQLLLSKLVDRVSPAKLLHVSLLGAFLSMAGLMVARSYPVMLFLWALAGLLQFACWPAVVRIVSQYLLPDMRGKAMISIAFCYCTGALVNSLSASILLKFWNWRSIFGLSLILVIIVWLLFWYLSNKTMPLLESGIKVHQTPPSKTRHKKSHKNLKLMFLSGIMIMVIPAFIRAMLDSGLKSWVPTLIMEKYPVSSSFASLLTTFLMFVNLSGVFLASWIYSHLAKNEAMDMGFLFIAAIPCLFLLTRAGTISLWMAVLLLTLITTFMYAGNQIININMPARFAALNLSGGIAAIVNGGASMGIVGANIGFGFLADHFGWNVTIWIWIGLAALGGVTSFLATRRWKRFTRKK